MSRFADSEPTSSEDGPRWEPWTQAGPGGLASGSPYTDRAAAETDMLARVLGPQPIPQGTHPCTKTKILVGKGHFPD